MAIFSKIFDEDDFQQLTITETTEPFPLAARSDALKAHDEQGSTWKFKYEVKSRSKRVLSGPDWAKFRLNNNVQVGDTVAFLDRDAWACKADYKIEVIKRGS